MTLLPKEYFTKVLFYINLQSEEAAKFILSSVENEDLSALEPSVKHEIIHKLLKLFNRIKVNTSVKAQIINVKAAR